MAVSAATSVSVDICSYVESRSVRPLFYRQFRCLVVVPMCNRPYVTTPTLKTALHLATRFSYLLFHFKHNMCLVLEQTMRSFVKGRGLISASQRYRVACPRRSATSRAALQQCLELHVSFTFGTMSEILSLVAYFMTIYVLMEEDI